MQCIYRCPVSLKPWTIYIFLFLSQLYAMASNKSIMWKYFCCVEVTASEKLCEQWTYWAYLYQNSIIAYGRLNSVELITVGHIASVYSEVKLQFKGSTHSHQGNPVVISLQGTTQGGICWPQSIEIVPISRHQHQHRQAGLYILAVSIGPNKVDST